MDTTYTFPDANVDPRLKDYKWILQYAKAAYNRSKTFCGQGLYFAKLKMQEERDYARGEQSVNKYKKQLSVDDITDESWLNVDWSVPDFLSKYRNIAVAKLLQRNYDTQCFAVDPLSKSEEDAYFNQMKIKIMMREMAEQQGSELAESPLLKGEANEPEDMEQLKIEMDYGYKHVLSMEAEEGIELIKQQNDISERRKRVVENLVDHGIGGYATWIDENGLCKFRELDPMNLILSPCVKNNFSDLEYWGEIIEVCVADLVPYFDAEQIKKICDSVRGKQGNPELIQSDTSYWEKFKVYVMDGKNISYNRLVYENRVDDRNNERFGRTNPNKSSGVLISTSDEGEQEPRYIDATQKVTYKFKWIINTDMMYDWGLSENMVRKPSSWWDTDLDIQLYSWNFDKMKFSGLVKKLMPLEDRACIIWYSLQNLSNKLIPYLINIDMGSIENNGFGKGGEKMKPSELIDFIFSNFIVPYRRNDLLKDNNSYKPVEIQDTGQLAVFQQKYNELMGVIELMRQTSGLNELTDGSTVNARNQNSTNEGMEVSTNNALYLIQNADKSLIHKLSESIVLKIQIAVKIGKVQGYLRALGGETVKFLNINPDIKLREFGVFVEDAPTQQQRDMLWQEVNMKESMGLLDVTDKVLIMSCRNLKKAMMVLGYRIKKRKEEQQQQELAKIQEANQGQQQTMIMGEQMKQQTMQMQAQIDFQKILLEGEVNFKIESMKKSMDLQGEMHQAEGRFEVGNVAAQAKVLSSHIAGQAAIEKQQVANKKPIPKKKKVA